MIRVDVGGHTVELYDCIEELPMARFHKFNKMLLIDSGVGSDIADVGAHIERVSHYIDLGKTEEARTELENMRQGIYMVMNGVNTRHLAFAALVHSVDGQPRGDLSDEGLRVTLSLLAEVPVCELSRLVSAAKKKIDDELLAYFPSQFEDTRSKEYYDLLRRRTLAIVDALVEGDMESRESEIRDFSVQLIEYTRPQRFGGRDNMEIRYDKNFESMCIVMSQRLNANPKQYTVMEYYAAAEHIEKEIETMNKTLKKHR